MTASDFEAATMIDEAGAGKASWVQPAVTRIDTMDAENSLSNISADALYSKS
jgi:hypothetical protein